VPLVSWVNAGDWCDAEDPYRPGDAEDWLICPFDHSENAFCLKVSGDSMNPEYLDGHIILVDPSVRPEHGDDVVARTPGGAASFKRLQITPEGMHLEALNPHWPNRVIVAPEGTVICGVVTASWVSRKKRK
jgi:SOS-response transcriptional repressor LexA